MQGQHLTVDVALSGMATLGGLRAKTLLALVDVVEFGHFCFLLMAPGEVWKLAVIPPTSHRIEGVVVVCLGPSLNIIAAGSLYWRRLAPFISAVSRCCVLPLSADVDCCCRGFTAVVILQPSLLSSLCRKTRST